MNNLEKIVDAVAEIINVGEKIVNKDGIWHLLALTDEVSALGTLNKDALLLELASLSKEDRLALQEKFKAKLSLKNKALEAKIESGVLTLEKGVDIVLNAVKVYNDALVVVQEVKVLIA